MSTTADEERTEEGTEDFDPDALEGSSIDDRADGGAAEEVPPTPPMQIPLPGTRDTIATSFGGARPTSSEIRLLGGKMPIEGSFDKGEEIELLVRVKVTGVLGQDVLDDWGATQKTYRRHMARMIEVRRFGDTD